MDFGGFLVFFFRGFEVNFELLVFREILDFLI